MKRIYLWLLGPVVMALAAGAPGLAGAQTTPASHQEGFECIIDLTDLGPMLPAAYTGSTSITIIPPTLGTTSRLCTGSSPNENIKLTCDTTIMDWPATYASASGFVCMMDTDPCDVAEASGLVQATKSQLTVDEFGEAKLICHWQP